jgi:hypothetical protein
MAERIVIEQETVSITNGEGGNGQQSAPVESWLRQVTRNALRGLTKEPLADNVKWLVSCGVVDVVIVQLDPALRAVQWIAPNSPAPFGPKATVRQRRLATPYVILKVPFRKKRIQQRVDVFYRNEPLQSASGPGGELYWPNLLNVSPNAHDCLSWFCTQFLEQEGPLQGLRRGLDAVTHHLWGGHFNLSSEAHEGLSTFGKAREDGVDPRVTDVDRWEAESITDPRFVLSVDWRSTGMDVYRLVLSELSAQGVEPFPKSASTLANHVLRCQRQASGGFDED